MISDGEMETVYLSIENLYLYEDYINPDVAENIGREFFRGLVVCKGDVPCAAIVWEFLHLYDEHHPTVSRISWMKISDREAGEMLMDLYTEVMDENDVERSIFEFEAETVRDETEILKQNGFKVLEGEGSRIELKLEDFKNLSFLKKGKIPSYIKSIGELQKRTFRRGVADCVYYTKRDLSPDIIRLPLEWYEPELSCCNESDDECNGFLLVHKCVSGKMRIELLADWGPEPQIDMLYMIRYSLKQAFKLYPPDTKVIIIRSDKALIKLVSYLFPNKHGLKCVGGKRSESKEET